MKTPPRTVIGVCLGYRSGAMVTATVADGIATAIDLRRYGSLLGPLAADVREALLSNPDAQVRVDVGLRGRDLLLHLNPERRERRLEPINPGQGEDRRHEIAGRLMDAVESGAVRIPDRLMDTDLRAELLAAAREDAGDRPEVVALSLALAAPPPRQPRFGVGF